MDVLLLLYRWAMLLTLTPEASKWGIALACSGQLSQVECHQERDWRLPIIQVVAHQTGATPEFPHTSLPSGMEPFLFISSLHRKTQPVCLQGTEERRHTLPIQLSSLTRLTLKTLLGRFSQMHLCLPSQDESCGAETPL